MKEKVLYQIWKNELINKPLLTNGGEEIRILHPGEQNENEDGPDFKNAKIKIGNITFIGDVEIDLKQNDWWNHGHKKDEKYSKVILHVSAFKKKFNYLFNLYNRKVYTLDLSNYVDMEKLSLLSNKNFDDENKQFIYCENFISSDSKENIINFVNKLGYERFQKKARRILDRLKELSYAKKISEPIVVYQFGEDFYSKEFKPEDFKDKDIWEQTFYEFIFEALGYSLNKEIMIKLAQAVDLNFIKKIIDSNEDKILIIESVLFNISGLFESAIELSDSYEKKILELWRKYDKIYDGERFERSQWKFFRIRPQNFPTIRLAGGSRIIIKIIFENFLKNIFSILSLEFDSKEIIGKLQELFIIKAEGYWKTNYDFGKSANENFKYFIGISRADEIIMNVVLPFAYVYGDIFNKINLKTKAITLFSNYDIKENNSITEKLSEIFGIKSDKALIYQGLLELYRSWCCKKKCSQCPNYLSLNKINETEKKLSF
jgi:hypothetical protein